MACNIRGYLWDLLDSTLWPFSTLDSRKSLGALLEKLKPMTQKSADFYACDTCDPRKLKHSAHLVKQTKLSYKGECLGCWKRSYSGAASLCKACNTKHVADSDFTGSSRKRLHV